MPSVINDEVTSGFIGLTDVLAFLKEITPEIEKSAPIAANTTDTIILMAKGVPFPGKIIDINHIMVAKSKRSNNGGIFSSSIDIFIRRIHLDD